MSRALATQRADGAPHLQGGGRPAPAAGRISETATSKIAVLEGMDRDALLALWSAMLGTEPLARMSQTFLRRVLAWELQAREQGGLPAAVTRKLESLAAQQAGGKEKVTAPKLKAGGRLLREWGGVTHVVDVVEGGFLWRGERHRSLSAIARAITGAHWSGPRFFGLPRSAGVAGGTKGSVRADKSSRPSSVKASGIATEAAAPSRGRSAA